MLACWSNFRAASPGVGQRQSDATSGLCHVLTRGIGKNPDTTLLKNGDLDGALADYTEAIRLKPDHASTHYKGLVRQKKSDVDGALADFQKYLDLGGGVRNGDQARLKPGSRPSGKTQVGETVVSTLSSASAMAHPAVRVLSVNAYKGREHTTMPPGRNSAPFLPVLVGHARLSQTEIPS